ncbi:hypothetical protein SASPL_116359 [Salvia splendens]|uniref:Fungal lipase-type domain-containing protein n=1 Tax=Salvia splendens TaxID=180675 RepID=A0A8X8ZWN7_SALSN|nr:hypothetical protein SASPL_116359 [Salvia splendens]
MGDDDNEINYFSKNYLCLRAEAASWFHCFKILHSNDLENTDFCNTQIEEDGVAGFRYRWIVFISLLLQKAFLHLKKPVAAIGATVELFLNYPAFNGGCRHFFFNIFTGRLVKPDKTSEKFTSMVGNIDKRWDLKRHYYGNKALSIIAIMASKLSFSRSEINICSHVPRQKPNRDSIPRHRAIRHRCMAHRHRRLLVRVPRIRQNPQRLHEGPRPPETAGWPKQAPPPPKSFAYYALREKLKTLIHENNDARFILTGHSLGGALAILATGVMAMHDEEFLLRRYVYSNDVVPRLPYDDKAFMFKHFGPCFYFNSCYKGQVLEEEPDEDYFSLLYVLPKVLSAFYELIRGLILPWTNGEEYREGWFMKLFRVTALIAPGLTNHFPPDYDNAIRLQKN